MGDIKKNINNLDRVEMMETVESTRQVVVVKECERQPQRLLEEDFLTYNDFACESNNKWLRIFIPCR
jgi:hypothetical protein